MYDVRFCIVDFIDIWRTVNALIFVTVCIPITKAPPPSPVANHVPQSFPYKRICALCGMYIGNNHDHAGFSRNNLGPFCRSGFGNIYKRILLRGRDDKVAKSRYIQRESWDTYCWRLFGLIIGIRNTHTHVRAHTHTLRHIKYNVYI